MILRSESPEKFLRNQRCIICEKLGCMVRLITPPWRGGKNTGDNLLPVCIDHLYLPLKTAYSQYSSIKTWLLQHDRIDVVLELENKIRGILWE